MEIKKKKFSKGFTLLEMLVVLGIFSTVVASATDIFLMSSKAQRKVLAQEKVQADARFTLEVMAREARIDTIDYAYYAGAGGIVNPVSELAFIDPTNTPIRFKISDATTQSFCPHPTDTAKTCMLAIIGNGVPVAITPKDVIVRGAKFYITPPLDPNQYDSGLDAYIANAQPAITMLLGVETSQAGGNKSVVYVQTTISSRIYRR